MAHMKVRDVMNDRVVTVREDATVKEIVELLMSYDVSGVPVVDTGGHVIGMVSEGDLLGKEAGTGPKRRRLVEFVADVLKGRKSTWRRKIEGTTAADLMTTPVHTAAPDEDLRYPARRMLRLGVKRLPVIGDGRLVGILSRHDVLHVFDRPDADVARDVEHVIQGAMFVPPTDEVRVQVRDGVVKLTGSVQYWSGRQMVENLVRSVDGVIAVENELVFRLPDPHFAPM